MHLLCATHTFAPVGALSAQIPTLRANGLSWCTPSLFSKETLNESGPLRAVHLSRHTWRASAVLSLKLPAGRDEPPPSRPKPFQNNKLRTLKLKPETQQTLIAQDNFPLSPLPGLSVSLVIDSGLGAARAEDAQGTPTQSHISPSILVYADTISPGLSTDIMPLPAWGARRRGGHCKERVVCERNRVPSRTTTPAGGLRL